MMKLFLIVFLISIKSSIFFGQHLLSQQSKIVISTDFSFQRMDAFLNFSVQRRIKYFELGTAVGLGIEKTLLQKRFSPHFELFSFYNFIQRELGKKQGITFGPGLLIDFTTYNIQTPIYYKDVFLAYNLNIGRKYKFIHQAGIGYMSETFKSNNGRIASNSINYFVKLGLAYAIY